MTALLLKWFVKDADPVAARAAVGKLAGFVGIVCNALLFIGKTAIGLMASSVSVIADAVNNLSDMSSSIITLLAFRISQKPADKDHPYGHARYEYLAGLVVSLLILLIGTQLAVSSVKKIFQPTAVSMSAIGFAILAASVLVKLWMTVFYRTLAKRIRSTALKATSDDCRNDVITSSAVLLGCLAEKFFDIQIDGFLGLGVAIFILVSGLSLAKEATSPLLGGQADQELVDSLTALLHSNDKILGFHDLLIHDYGPSRCFASVHAELSADEPPMACHDILDGIERQALEELNVRLVIHYDPVDVQNTEQYQLRRTVKGIAKEICQEFSLHDFRIVQKDSNTVLTFDLCVPYAYRDRHDEIRTAIESALAQQGLPCITDICFDEKE